MTALVEVRDLVKHYPAPRPGLFGAPPPVRAVDGVSFSITAGETLALVGESGSGKSTLGRLVLHLEAPTSGTVWVNGQDLAALSARDLRRLRRRMQPIFQDPAASLNPRRNVGNAIGEALAIHRIGTRASRVARIHELLELVGLDSALASHLPHQLSGGQRQRVGIARALALGPEFLVCDEPVSSLDVSVQAQVLNLMSELKARHQLSMLFIAHDLAVVRQMADRVAVMYFGVIVEMGTAEEVIGRPRHPYTQALCSATPNPDPDSSRRRIVLSGEPPSPSAPPPGCPFAPRCQHPERDARCMSERPSLRRVGPQDVACHYAR